VLIIPEETNNCFFKVKVMVLKTTWQNLSKPFTEMCPFACINNVIFVASTHTCMMDANI
jgi:hypothetical protein